MRSSKRCPGLVSFWGLRSRWRLATSDVLPGRVILRATAARSIPNAFPTGRRKRRTTRSAGTNIWRGLLWKERTLPSVTMRIAANGLTEKLRRKETAPYERRAHVPTDEGRYLQIFTGS